MTVVNPDDTNTYITEAYEARLLLSTATVLGSMI